jgi:hypothetical protein
MTNGKTKQRGALRQSAKSCAEPVDYCGERPAPERRCRLKRRNSFEIGAARWRSGAAWFSGAAVENFPYSAVPRGTDGGTDSDWEFVEKRAEAPSEAQLDACLSMRACQSSFARNWILFRPQNGRWDKPMR